MVLFQLIGAVFVRRYAKRRWT